MNPDFEEARMQEHNIFGYITGSFSRLERWMELCYVNKTFHMQRPVLSVG